MVASGSLSIIFFHFALFINPLILLSLYSLVVTDTIYKFVRVLQAKSVKFKFLSTERSLLEQKQTEKVAQEVLDWSLKSAEQGNTKA